MSSLETPNLPGYSSDGQTALLVFRLGPSSHGAVGYYCLTKRAGRWAITGGRIGYYDSWAINLRTGARRPCSHLRRDAAGSITLAPKLVWGSECSFELVKSIWTPFGPKTKMEKAPATPGHPHEPAVEQIEG